jgi:hypothetical protein
MLHKRDLSGTVTVDGIDYRWTLRREPQWSTAESYKGMAIGVQLEERPSREALLEFPFRWRSRRSTPHLQRPQVQRDQLEAGIRAALALGWDPASKGKPVVVELE